MRKAIPSIARPHLYSWRGANRYYSEEILAINHCITYTTLGEHHPDFSIESAPVSCAVQVAEARLLRSADEIRAHFSTRGNKRERAIAVSYVHHSRLNVRVSPEQKLD